MTGFICIYVVQAESRDFRRQKLLKHPQNSYSIERVCRELSKTPSYALIDAIGGSIHHFECAGRAFSGPNQTARAAHSRVPDPLPLMRPCGPALARLAEIGSETAHVVYSKSESARVVYSK